MLNFARKLGLCICVFLFGLAAGIWLGRRGSVLDTSELAVSTDFRNPPPILTDIDREANNPLSPIKFDAKVNEYQLVYGYKTNGVEHIFYFPLRYCPWTGKRLPESKRPDALLRVRPSGVELTIPPHTFHEITTNDVKLKPVDREAN